MNGLDERLREAEQTLQRMAAAQVGESRARLLGKAEGIRLAMAYAHETGAAAGEPGSRIPPQTWTLTANAIAHLRVLVAERGSKGTQELDQLRATIRDELDKLNVSLGDEVAVYHGLVWTGLVTELARYGYNNGAIGDETYKAVAEIATTIASALLDYVPKTVGR